MSEMSFLPEDYLDKRVEMRTNLICLVLFCLVLAGNIGAYLVTSRQGQLEKKKNREINVKFEEAAKRIKQVEELQKNKQDMVRKARVTAQLVERVPRTLILSELINKMPQELSLLELELDTKVVRTKRPNSASALGAAKGQSAQTENGEPEEPLVRQDVNVKLVGVAPTDVDVAEFMHAIGQAHMFNDVSLSFSEQVDIESQTLRKFQIDMKLNVEVDVTQYEPSQIPRELMKNPMGSQFTIGPDGKPIIPLRQLVPLDLGGTPSDLQSSRGQED